jgi:uncharacterized protein with PQ loop repeat
MDVVPAQGGTLGEKARVVQGSVAQTISNWAVVNTFMFLTQLAWTLTTGTANATSYQMQIMAEIGSKLTLP